MCKKKKKKKSDCQQRNLKLFGAFVNTIMSYNVTLKELHADRQQ